LNVSLQTLPSALLHREHALAHCNVQLITNRTSQQSRYVDR